jgi:hypothetical protein
VSTSVVVLLISDLALGVQWLLLSRHSATHQFERHFLEKSSSVKKIVGGNRSFDRVVYGTAEFRNDINEPEILDSTCPSNHCYQQKFVWDVLSSWARDVTDSIADISVCTQARGLIKRALNNMIQQESRRKRM